MLRKEVTALLYTTRKSDTRPMLHETDACPSLRETMEHVSSSRRSGPYILYKDIHVLTRDPLSLMIHNADLCWASSLLLVSSSLKVLTPSSRCPYPLEVMSSSLSQLLACFTSLFQMSHVVSPVMWHPFASWNPIVLPHGKPTHMAPLSAWDLMDLSLLAFLSRNPPWKYLLTLPLFSRQVEGDLFFKACT